MIYLFDKDEKLIKIVRKSAVKTALQKYALTTERYVSDRLTVELKGLNADELEQVEYMAIQTMEDAHTFHYFYVAQKFSDELTTLIGVQSGIEELRKSPVFDKRPKNAFARDVITDLLAGTNWQARFVGETAPHSTNFYYTSIFDALKKVCEVWDLEMQFFVEMNGNRIGARYIDFKQKIGQAVGKRVVYGHNALQILQEVERTNIFTALIGRGKGEETGDGYGRKITFENVVWSRTQGKPVDKPKGQKYLELPLMTRQYGIKNDDGSMRPKIGFVDFSEEENPEVLIERTYRALIDAARPQLTLKTSSVYLRGVEVGDTIRVVRHDKKLDYDTRVFEITFNRLNNQSSDIKLGDRIGESNEAKAQTIADKAVEQFVNNEFSNFVQNLPDYLPSADGFNNNWYGAEEPIVQYPGKVLINDIWYKPDPEHEGHKIMLRWTGEVWEEILRTYESESLRERIAEEIAQVEQSMQAQSEEHDRQVADILARTGANADLANAAKQLAERAQADLATTRSNLTVLIAQTDTKAGQLEQSITSVRADVASQAWSILAQAQAQTALTNRVTTVETLADGTRSTVAELSKTVNKATGDITSVTNRTKVVEDGLVGVKNSYGTINQKVNTQTGQITSINQRTAQLESGLSGIKEKFENIKIGSRNYFSQYLANYDTSGTYATRLVSETQPITVTVTDKDTSVDVSGCYFGLFKDKAAKQGAQWFLSNGTLNNAKKTITGWPMLAVYPKNQATLDKIFSRYKVMVEIGNIATDWVPAEEDLATVTALHSVRDTVDSHTRTIGAVGETGSILDNVSKVTQTAKGLVTEVSGTNGLKTQVSQLNNSYAIKNLTSAGNVLGQINLNPDGSVRINEGLISVGTKTYIKDGVITSAKIANLDAGKITSGYLAAARIAANSIDGSKLVFDQAFVNKMTANEALFKQLFAKNAFITAVQAVSISASQITSGVMRATNGAMKVNLNAGQILYYTDQAALKRVLTGYPTQFVKFATGTVSGKGNAGVTVIGSNRWNSESSNDGGFVGIRAWNGTDIDQIDVVGDTVRLASSAFEASDGWDVVTLPNKLEIDAHNSDHRVSSKVKVGDVWLWKNATTYSSMKDTINLIIDNLQTLHNNKSTERAYSYTLPAKI
ncbi:TPA: phage tail protein [Streptococcus suis]|nr:phage tail protein [Streptococcus suis]